MFLQSSEMPDDKQSVHELLRLLPDEHSGARGPSAGGNSQSYPLILHGTGCMSGKQEPEQDPLWTGTAVQAEFSQHSNQVLLQKFVQ